MRPKSNPFARLVDADGEARFQNRAQFFGAAAEAMRRILVAAARRKLAQRPGGRQERLDVDEIELAAPAGGHDLDELTPLEHARE